MSFVEWRLLRLKVLKREEWKHESRNEMKVIQVKNRFQSRFCQANEGRKNALIHTHTHTRLQMKIVWR